MPPVLVSRRTGRRPAKPRRPRRLAVVHDYPRATGALGRPVLEAARVVPLRPLFPRHRTVSDGQAYEDVAWWARTAANRARWQSQLNRDRSVFARAWS